MCIIHYKDMYLKINIHTDRPISIPTHCTQLRYQTFFSILNKVAGH